MTLMRKGIRVVIVDDHEDNADMLAGLLQHLGHEVRIAHRAARSLELLDEELPDVVQRAERSGIDAFVVKLFKPTQLEALIGEEREA